MTVMVTKEITFEMAHRLSKHPGACRNIHGHTYRLAVTLKGLAVDDDKVIDFAVLGQILREEFVTGPACWDHALLVNPDDPLFGRGMVAIRAHFEASGLRIRDMGIAVDPTAEAMAQEVRARLERRGFDGRHGLVVHAVTLWETPTASATSYRPEPTP